MSEQQQQLRDKLAELDAELSRTAPADDAQRARLEALRADVERLRQRAADPTGAGEPIEHGLKENLEHFEATHPVLSTLIEQVLNTLSAAGI